MNNHNFSYSGRLLRILELIVLSGVILYFGRPILIPLAFAWLTSILLYPFCHWMEGHRLPRPLAIILSLLLLLIFITIPIGIIIWQLSLFSDTFPSLLERIRLMLIDIQHFLAVNFSITIGEQMAWVRKSLMQLGSHMGGFLENAFQATTRLLIFLVLVPFFSALFLYHRRLLVNFLYKITPAGMHTNLKSIIRETIITYYNYVKGVLIVYFIVAILNSLGLYLLDIKHPIFFGIIASVLTIIPYIGITVGSLLPISLAWINHDSLLYPLGVVAVFAFVQYLEANFIFPVAVGVKLKINTLVTLTSVFIGAILWGAAGMILFIPFVAILKVIADKVEPLKPLGEVLGHEHI